MPEGKIVVSIILGLVAVTSGGIALVLFFQTLSGLGSGGLAFTGVPILILGGVCVLSIVQISRWAKEQTQEDK